MSCPDVFFELALRFDFPPTDEKLAAFMSEYPKGTEGLEQLVEHVEIWRELEVAEPVPGEDHDARWR